MPLRGPSDCEYKWFHYVVLFFVKQKEHLYVFFMTTWYIKHYIFSFLGVIAMPYGHVCTQ